MPTGRRELAAAVANDVLLTFGGMLGGPIPVPGLTTVEALSTPTTLVPSPGSAEQTVSWSSTNVAVATVDVFGNASGVAPGPTTIVASVGAITCLPDSCGALTVSNAVPSVQIFSGQNTLNVGQSFTPNGSFFDRDPQMWTATVDYGDAGHPNPQNLPLTLSSPGGMGPTGSFSLSHVYTTARTYTVTVRVTDSEGAVGEATKQVTVNLAPIFLGLPNSVSVQVNSTNWGCGSFSDANGGAWTVSIDYGDGSPTQTLSPIVPASGPCAFGGGGAPPTGVFSFDHSYSSEGNFQISVTITNTVTYASKSGGFTANVTDNRCAQLTLNFLGNVPFSVVPVTVTSPEGTYDNALPVGTTTFMLERGEEGVYHIQFHPPPGFAVSPDHLDFTVTCGHDVTLSAQVSAVDTTPPVIMSVTPSTGLLWPPNHKMVGVSVSVQATDNVDPSPVCAIVSVASNEPDNGLGDGDTPNDFVITGPLTVNLRAERPGNGGGRVYMITVRCTDLNGLSSTETTTVTVPHNQ